MRCLMCENLSLSHICKKCQNNFLTPSIYRRKILGNIEVISFYKYGDIKELLHTKHTDIGYYIYSILAKNSITKFASEFEYPHKVVSIGVDDYTKSGYSHTAILNRALKSRYIKPLFGKLRAKNRVSYSGKTKQFRLLNPRDFELKELNVKSAILVDDIITTSSTLTQAVEALQKENIETLFCLTLASASVN
ncbi:ComF family protein [Sulfurimonas crateris]|uniref:ComF family protein n=1 Tax=Sulfurimonas crateris TaxID=2574727 RepID=A0A4U2Z550_9BACT|nr:ComF family protein [Sulfurimonas crateris]TKI68974.1 ComF family protein [Sulfurimonas crateris]